MTLPTSTRVTDPYETDGVQRDFEFDFPAFYNADTGHYGIEVRRLTELEYEVIDKSLYDIFLNDEDKSGYIRFHVAPMAGDDIYIAGDTTRSQQLNLINYGRYSAQSIEKAFDLIVALIQEFVSKVDEETRQRILSDQALRDFLLIKFNQFTAEVTTKIDKHIGDINGFMSSLIPMFVCIMRKEIANYAETGMMQVINDFMDNEIEPLITEKVNSYLEQTDFAGAVNQVVAPIAEYVPLPFDSQKTYEVNQRVTLSNGDIVESTVAGNTVDPNVDMAGWVNPRKKQDAKNSESISTADFGSAGKAQNIPVSAWYTPSSPYYRGYSNLAAVKVDYPHVTSATNTVDWAAAQAAVNSQGAYGQCLIDGCLFFAQGETLVLPLGFKLFGKDSNLFINTNSGNYFVGSLTGQIPKYGIYYDGTTGVAINAAAGVSLEDFHLFGKGYTVADGSVNILDIGDANVYDTVGVAVDKFITTRNMSVFYLGTAFNTVGGNYYSRFYNTEVTRCNTAFAYTVTTYNQHFYGCIIRNTPTPFFFDTGVACRNFNYFGGSIEGYRPKGGTIYAIGVPANSILRFEGTYFESLDTFGTFDSMFGFKGGDCYLQFNGCTAYLNHYNNFVRQTGFTRIRVKSTGNEFYLSSGSRVKNPVIYNLNFTEGSSYLYTDGSDKLPYQTSVPAFTAQGTISAGSTSLVVSDASTMFVGMRVRSAVDTSYETIIRSISGNTVTLQAPAPSNMTTSSFQFYLSPQYIPFSTGAGLLANHSIIFPDKYFPAFDYLNFAGKNGENRGSLSRAPYSPFNGGVNSVSTYVADYANWNPSGKSDARGAYPVVFRGGKYFPQLGSFAGSFTFAAGTAFTVPDTNVAASSKIMLMPTNAAAATLLKEGMYISSKANNTSFTVTALTTAVGTETFDYTITD